MEGAKTISRRLASTNNMSDILFFEHNLKSLENEGFLDSDVRSFVQNVKIPKILEFSVISTSS